jgi:hypothetical protein
MAALVVAGCGKDAGGPEQPVQPAPGAAAPGGEGLARPSAEAPSVDRSPAASAAADAGVAPGEGGAESFWGGTLSAPGAELAVGVALTRQAGGAWSGTIDIPIQNAKDLPLRDVALDATTIRFTIAPPGAPEAAHAKVELTLEDGGKAARGTLRQAGQQVPVVLRRVASREQMLAPQRRPQTPRPPFPYATREVLYDNPADGSKIAGELTIPKGAGPHPAALLISGSGSQDRDETIFGHKPFLLLADALTSQGIAVLRTDDRGVGKSTGATDQATVQTHAGDVKAGLAFLRAQPEVDAKRVGLVGHSEGGLIAALVAAEDRELAFIVSLAGPGVPGKALILMQQRAILDASPDIPAATKDAMVAAQTKIMAAVAGDADEAALVALVRQGLAAGLKAGAPGQAAMAEADLDRAAAAAAKQVSHAWFRSFVTLDPAPLWAKVSCPTLALVGERDLQVPADANLEAIKKALAAGGNEDFEASKLPGLNHLFQQAQTGLVDEYAKLEWTFDVPTLKRITDWIRARTGLAQRAP